MQQVSAGSSASRFLSCPRPNPAPNRLFQIKNIPAKDSGENMTTQAKNCRLSPFAQCVAGMQLGPGITVNYSGRAHRNRALVLAQKLPDACVLAGVTPQNQQRLASGVKHS